MTSDGLKNMGKHVRPANACARSYWYTKDSVFWLAQMTLWHYNVGNFPPFVRPNIISNGPTNGLWIRQLRDTINWPWPSKPRLSCRITRPMLYFLALLCDPDIAVGLVGESTTSRSSCARRANSWFCTRCSYKKNKCMFNLIFKLTMNKNINYTYT